MTDAPVIAARSTACPPIEDGLRWIAPTMPLDYNGPALAYEAPNEDFLGRHVYERFETVAARKADAVALADRAGRLTYAQVQSAARRLAAELIAGTPAASAVAVLLPNNAMSLVATLACFAAGRVCVLLNAEHPAERNRAILRRAA
jgi:non-ribosomal peptide synthetase component F